MEIDDSRQPSNSPDPSSSGPGDSGGSRSSGRRPRPEGRSGDRSPRHGRERSGPGGDRRGGRGGRDRGGRGGDGPDRRRGGPREREERVADAPVAKTQSPPPQADPLQELGGDLLASVSRSFSLTIQLLPDALRAPISVGYLLARAMDTVADTPGVVPGARLEHLRALLDMIKYGVDPEILRPLQRDLVGKQTHDGERNLLKGLDRCLNWLEAQSTEDRWDLRRTLARIGRGQELDLLRFGEGTATAPKPLQTALELDEYTYFVAGCVGELWTNLCQRHLSADWAGKPQPEMLALGKRFGQGLQMVNILRDLPEDLANGRCYLPVDLLEQQGLTVTDLLDSPAKARPLLDQLCQKTLDHLDAAWQYTLALRPRKLRLACALPVLIGLETLGLLAKESPLEARERLKVSRSSVKKLMFSVSVGTFFAPWLNRTHRKLRAQATGR